MIENLIIYWPYALLGLIISMLLDVSASDKPVADLTFKIWLSKNGKRLLLSVCAIIAGLLFSKEFLNMDINPMTAFWGGLGSDSIVNMLKKIKRSKNISSSDKKD